ncbi:NAD-dependent epimerase/dehydratase family protein [Polyangium aurulentum]|uniref:NAD-dependent epimerase/dehydratase family protein n=1 Tax=Polyangium aurulentum TaxID=2567896 RepID=UPI0010ADF635|nr:NAD-dependent epimerase/dehydratase family protein [Polyangium aurulentum]UQA62988.1 NAD-dependent epimerase/dehydratase family protein [Polyangium aurulentum]
MHVLVIGGTRFVGPLVVFRLLAGGHRVTLFNRGTRPDPFGDRVERLSGDRTTEDLWRKTSDRSFDAVVDFAAYHREDVLGAVEALSGRVGHYIFIGTGQVYLVRQSCPRPASEADYDGPLMSRPDDPEDAAQWDYGIGKRACEDALVEAWASERFPATRIRIPMVNGERDHYRRLERYLWRLTDGGPLLVPGGGAHSVRHVYAGEVARAIVHMLGRSETFGGAYNVCQRETPTLVELLGMLGAMVGARPKLVSVTAAELENAGLSPRELSPFSGRWMSMIEPSKVESELGFVHEPLESYLGKIAASFFAHPPATPPEGYERRKEEIALAEKWLTKRATVPPPGMGA